jgi:hypothetical protein
MGYNVCALVSKGTANNGALARYDVLGAVSIDVVLQVEAQYLDGA